MFVIVCSSVNYDYAQWLCDQLILGGYTACIAAAESECPLNEAEALFVVLTSNMAAPSLLQAVAEAKQLSIAIYLTLFEETAFIPPFFNDSSLLDLTANREQGLEQFIRLQFTQRHSEMTVGDARDHYLSRATLKSVHTMDSYRRAIKLFFEFLGDKSASPAIPLRWSYPTPEDIPLIALGEADASLLLQFAQWLSAPASGKTDDHRPYKAATVELRVAGVQNWLQFLDEQGWLSKRFPLAKAKQLVHHKMRSRLSHKNPRHPSNHIDEIISYYDTQEMPRALKRPDANMDRIRRWELTRLRNCALLHALAETGGRISELLSLNLDSFLEARLNQNEVLRIKVRGKSGHTYNLHFFDALPAIQTYIRMRGFDTATMPQKDIPLFVSHDSRYDGSRMSRIVAWRIVQRAAHALGLDDITPHDIRHWRANQLINSGQSLDVVQEYLGHRSIETTRAYYAHRDEEG